MEIFIKRLKGLRKSNKLTQQQLADSLCITRSELSDLESGKEDPHPLLLTRLSNVFGVSVDYLLGNVIESVTKYKTLSLPRLNNLKPTIDSTLIKAMEELGELAQVVGKFHNKSGEQNTIGQEQLVKKLCSELLDVSQTTVSLMFVLEELYGVDIEAEVIRHVKKLKKKKYIV
jgi:transcriptional regulator with XRE-family HTH domain